MVNCTELINKEQECILEPFYRKNRPTIPYYSTIGITCPET
jgi:hypothetical protein